MNGRRSQSTATPQPTEDATTHFKQKFAITPKTASLLIQLGFKNYIELRNCTPAGLVSRLATLPGVTSSQAETYRRGFRRMVWLATLAEPEVVAKTCPDWTRKGLEARGWWEEGYDELTGVQVADKVNALK